MFPSFGQIKVYCDFVVLHTKWLILFIFCKHIYKRRRFSDLWTLGVSSNRSTELCFYVDHAQNTETCSWE